MIRLIFVFTMLSLLVGCLFTVESTDELESQCLADYNLLLPDSILLAGQLLVSETQMPYQPVNQTVLLHIDGEQILLIDGQYHTAVGELCWTGDPNSPKPTFTKIGLRDKDGGNIESPNSDVIVQQSD